MFFQNDDSKTLLKLVVEVDGHEFHEETKEQVRHDKQRDRNLMMMGYKSVHFAGSEVYKNVQKCTQEIHALVDQHKNI